MLQMLEQRSGNKAALRILESIVRTVTGQLRWARTELIRLETG